MSDRKEGASILIATYNGAAFLDAQLQSIVAQLSFEDELIILDDGSSDRSLEIVERYARDHPNIRPMRNPHNLGVRATFEALLAASQRDIIILSDQDDIWIEGRKKLMVEALQTEGYVAVLTNALVLTELGADRSFFPAGRQPNVASIAANFLRNNFIGCCMAFRRDLLTLAMPFPRSISMHDWWIGSCAMALGRVRYVAEPTLYYRRHGSNQSAGARRPWRVVAGDRSGNLLALATLFRRLVRLRRTT